MNTVPGNLNADIVGVTRWVGSAHLDRYLAKFRYRFNRRFGMKSMQPRLLIVAAPTPVEPQLLLKMAWTGRASNLRASFAVPAWRLDLF